MAEPVASPAFSDLPGQDGALPRCCPRHDDWPTLARHVVADFPDLRRSEIVREIGRARDAATSMGLDDGDALLVAELIARHQLMLLGGDVPELARLDPERHVRGGQES